ncbi:MAG: DEAD/DEAH box helicase family protein [Solirubrobacteraceae bacterium MAG38_C4-C5]|nr:DEAD/DEAH box helicase family protein [Candidatus Siliceabacter maunaloa]
MSGLADLLLRTRYRSGEDDLVEDFYLPCLERATEYDRAVGYFTSGALALAAPALVPFLIHGGRMRLVVSPHLTEADVEAMLAGYHRRDEIVGEALRRELISAALPDPIRDTLSCLSWLIAHERLEVRVAVLSKAGAPGIYHEKIGVFRDDAGTHVAFQGSANESVGGLVNNFESILAFSTAKPSEALVANQLDRDFAALWNRELSTLEVIDLPDAARQTLLDTYTPDRAERLTQRSGGGPRRPATPDGLQIREYQREAMAAWFRARGTGVFEMATGSGKTITALSTAGRLAEECAKQDEGLAIVVLCPYQHLVKQWIAEANAFAFDPIGCFRGRSHWESELRSQLLELRAGARPTLMAIATNATFATLAFQDLIRELPEASLIIADEMHNLGAPALRRALPAWFRFRLGLSATPERHHDTEGTAALQRYFGSSVFELGLGEAIQMGALTRYRYRPIVIEFDGEELDQYLALSERIGLRMAIAGDDPDGDEMLMALLIRRARLIASASGKIPRLLELLEPERRSTHNLVYCGDGRVEADDGDDERQVEAVVRGLGQGLGMAVNRYTADVDVDQRDVLRERFASGSLNALVAIRCLDEGIDIPETRRAYILASSTNPRQFIQRRGRVLRRAPGKDLAEIYDFIVVPPASGDDNVDPSERKLMARELERVMEFAGLAVNGPEALAELRELRTRYDLLHIGT